MPGLPIEGSGEPDYASDMEARVRVLEEISASTKAMLAEIRADQRAMRAETTSGLAAVHAELAAGAVSLRSDMSSGFAAKRADMTNMELRRERDFRITFGAIITTTIGLACLIAHTAHWL
jgi:hypothetical protein